MCKKEIKQNWQRRKSQISDLGLETDFLNIFSGLTCLYVGFTPEKIDEIISRRYKFIVYDKKQPIDFNSIDFFILDFRASEDVSEQLLDNIKLVKEKKKEYLKPVLAIVASEYEFIGYLHNKIVDEYLRIDMLENLEVDISKVIVFLRIERLLAEKILSPFIDTNTGLVTKPLFLNNLEQWLLIHKEKNLPMSLVLVNIESLGLKDSHRESEICNQIIRSVARCIRKQDVKGVLDKNLIGLVLLETVKGNIVVIRKRIANVVKKISKENNIKIKFKVQEVSYPEDLQKDPSDEAKNKILEQYGESAGAMLNIALSKIISQGYKIQDINAFQEEISVLFSIQQALRKKQKVSKIGHDIKGELGGFYITGLLIDAFKEIEQIIQIIRTEDQNLTHIREIIDNLGPMIKEFGNVDTKVQGAVALTDSLMRLEKDEEPDVNEEKIEQLILGRKFIIDFILKQYKNFGVHKIEENYHFFVTKPKPARFSINIEEIGEISPIYVNVDNFKKIVVYQLLNNAIKYSPDGGNIIIKVTEDKDHLVFSIKDSGVGISIANQQKIFNGNRISEVYTDGSGLGLQTLKNYIKKMKGDIELQSEPGKGSTFVVKIPFIK